jgi:hypothetical protein
MNNRWPKELIIPQPKDFTYGYWIELTDEQADERDAQLSGAVFEDFDKVTGEIAKRDAPYDCGTQCCMVGWMGLAFKGPWEPVPLHLGGVTLSKPHRKFMETFLDLHSGKEDRSELSDDALFRLASDAFEGEESWNGFEIVRTGHLTPVDAHKLWKKVARICGYDC